MKKLIIASIIFSFSNTVYAKNIPLYTGNMTGLYYSFGSDFCDYFDCTEKATTGSLENIERLDKELEALAIVQSDVLKRYAGQLVPIQNLYTETYTLVVKENSNINSFRDLKGKVVNVNKINSGSYFSVENLLRAYQMNFSDFGKVSYLPSNAQFQALCNGDVDVSLAVIGHPNLALQAASYDCALKIVPLNDKEVKEFFSGAEAFVFVNVPKGIYSFSSESINTIGVKSVLVASKKLPSDKLKNLIHAVKQAYYRMKRDKPVFNGIALE